MTPLTTPLILLAAAPSADDVFKSMGESMQGDVNPVHVLAVIAAAVGLIVLVSLFAKRGGTPAKRAGDPVDNPNRLLRDMAKEVGLKRRDVRELKKLAALQGVENPLTLLLCPSLMQAAIAKRNSVAAGRG